MIFVENAKYIDGYKIELFFSNNEHGVIDLHDIINKDHRPIFRELQDVNKFRQFKVDMDTIVWENGLDLAPEFLYRNIRS